MTESIPLGWNLRDVPQKHRDSVLKLRQKALNYYSTEIQVADDRKVELLEDELTAPSSDRGAEMRSGHSNSRFDPIFLNCHEVTTRIFSEDSAVEASGIMGLFNGKLETVKSAVVHECKQYFEFNDSEYGSMEIGVAVRISVATEAFDASSSISLASIAAKAQLGMSQGEAKLTIHGYSGQLGSLLPAPSNFNVEAFHEYLESFKAIQDKVFHPDSIANYAPTDLNFMPNKLEA